MNSPRGCEGGSVKMSCGVPCRCHVLSASQTAFTWPCSPYCCPSCLTSQSATWRSSRRPAALIWAWLISSRWDLVIWEPGLLSLTWMWSTSSRQGFLLRFVCQKSDKNLTNDLLSAHLSVLAEVRLVAVWALLLTCRSGPRTWCQGELKCSRTGWTDSCLFALCVSDLQSLRDRQPACFFF